MKNLNEDQRSELLNKSRNADNYKDQSKGKNRYQRRVKSKVANSVKEFNSIDMNRLFKDNILNVDVKVQGETDSYLVKISFGGFLDILRRQLGDNEINYRYIVRSLIMAFNSDDVYIHCTCPDWKYRMAYWSTVNSINSGESESRASNITNPNDTKGKGCKHVLLVLSNNTWLNKVASTIWNYINYMKDHYENLYADIIYPAIYNKKYTGDVQTTFDDSDELDSSSDVLDTSNTDAVNRTRFKKGNTSGIRFASNNNAINKQLDFDSLGN